MPASPAGIRQGEDHQTVFEGHTDILRKIDGRANRLHVLVLRDNFPHREEDITEGQVDRRAGLGGALGWRGTLRRILLAATDTCTD